ncbi:MAG TPA: hypothetical protein PLD59_16970, partial [Tepidisphaeraceae bacterium]|nr:hypothetical protein [Tepidisphaeraceae bacterium]
MAHHVRVRCRELRFDSPTHPPWNCSAQNPRQLLVCNSRDRVTTLRVDGQPVRRWVDPMEALDWLGNSDAMRDPKSPRWAGYISYDLGRLFEPMPSIAADDLSLPLFMFVSTSRAPPGKLPAVSARQRPTLARP